MKHMRKGSGSGRYLLITVIAVLTAGIGIAYRDESPSPRMISGYAHATDGDSLRVGRSRIRLQGIDAMELRQFCRNERDQRYPCGRDAQRALTQLVKGRTVNCTVTGMDPYNRELAVCMSGDKDVGAEMVLTGQALAYLRYDPRYEEQEQIAKLNRHGVWRGKFVAPWVFRKNVK